MSKYLEEMGWTVGPVIALDRSPADDFANVRVVQWLIYLIELLHG